MKIITRAEAKASGLQRYFPGSSCKKGHVAERTTVDGQCTVCCNEKMRARRAIAKEVAALDTAKKFESALAAAKVQFSGSKRADGRLIERPIAKALGMETYFTGSGCSRGHIADRYVASGNCVVCSNAFHKERYANNKADYALKGREWVLKNPSYRREYRIRKPELHRAMDARTGAIRRNRKAGGVSSGALKAWIAAQKKVCYWCGLPCKQKYHIDHYQPLSKGGKHRISNLVIACPTCNLRKSSKDPLEFAASIGRLF